MNPLARVLALSTIAIAALVVAPTSAPALGRPCAAGELTVAVVVDFGTGSSVNITCVPAASRDNGAQLLGARASMLGTAPPRFNVSGLLCAIDNVPATGCGERTSGKYAYWSYWRGTNGTWVYSNSGPASQRVQADVVEGWRFQPSGAGNPSDPPPRASAYRRCPPATATTAPPATVAPAAPPPASVGGASGSAVTPTSALPRGSGAGVGGAAPTTRPLTAGATTSSTPRRTTVSTTARSTPTVRAGAAAAEAADSSDDGGGGIPVGLIVGVLLAATIGGAGALAARRRRAAAP
jgi:hypothetical protein